MEQQNESNTASQIAWGVVGIVALAALVFAFLAVSHTVAL